MRKFIVLFLFSIIYSTAFSQSYTVHTLAGDTSGYFNFADTGGYRNGTNDTALFNGPAGIAVDTASNVYVADYFSNRIRKINFTTSTLAGDTAGFRDGTGNNALFNGPLGVCVDDSLNVYVADTYNNAIRKITPAGVVTTIAGKGPDSAGYRDGFLKDALFMNPIGIAIDKQHNLYITDNGNNVVREISNMGVVYTIAGNDTIGFRNGADSIAEFSGLSGIALDDTGNIYVTEIGNNAIRKINPLGLVSTVAGFDTIGYDTLIYTIRPGYQNGGADTAMFNNPTGVIVADSGKIYVADEGNNVIRRIWHGTVTTFAGNRTAGFANGNVSNAEFYFPFALAKDNFGDIFVSDNGNNVVREIYPPGVTGVKNIVKENTTLQVYPNPCNSNLTVISSENGQADLLDLTGRVIWSTDHFVSPYTLPTTDIAPGVYFFRVHTHGNVAVSKVVVSH